MARTKVRILPSDLGGVRRAHGPLRLEMVEKAEPGRRAGGPGADRYLALWPVYSLAKRCRHRSAGGAGDGRLGGGDRRNRFSPGAVGGYRRNAGGPVVSGGRIRPPYGMSPHLPV